MADRPRRHQTALGGVGHAEQEQEVGHRHPEQHADRRGSWRRARDGGLPRLRGEMTQSQTGTARASPALARPRARTGPTSSTSDRAKAHRAGSAARLLSGGGACGVSARDSRTLRAPCREPSRLLRSALCTSPARSHDCAPVHLGLGQWPLVLLGFVRADSTIRGLYSLRPAQGRDGRAFRLIGVTAAQAQPLLEVRRAWARSRPPRGDRGGEQPRVQRGPVPHLLPALGDEVAGQGLLFKIPFVGWSMWLAGDIPVRRGDRDSARRPWPPAPAGSTAACR